MLHIVLIVLAALALIAVLLWIGLQVQPAPFAPVAQLQPPFDSVPLPGGLPAPVERFYRGLYGDNVPLIRTAVISGRGWVQPFPGPALPMRFRFTHVAGQDYRHYIEATLFGVPIMKINEYWVGGKERAETPFGVDTDNPKLDQGGFTGMWAESLQWLPAILVTDPQVHWEPVDADTAWLVVPFRDGQERFLVRFDPATGGIKYWETMRYQNGDGEKILWINGTWFARDQGKPWVNFNADDVRYNVDVDVSVAAKGP